jgi:excisionase family DNA binding protein
MINVDLTITEAAKLLAVPEGKIHELLEMGELYFKAKNGEYLIPSEQLDFKNLKNLQLI